MGPRLVRAEIPPTHAQAPGEQARSADEQARLAATIDELQSAYRNTGNAEFLFKLAETYRLAGQATAAERTYEAYLRRAPHGPHRAAAERQLRELDTASGPDAAPAAPARAATPAPPARAATPAPPAHASTPAPPAHAATPAPPAHASTPAPPARAATPAPPAHAATPAPPAHAATPAPAAHAATPAPPAHAATPAAPAAPARAAAPSKVALADSEPPPLPPTGPASEATSLPRASESAGSSSPSVTLSAEPASSGAALPLPAWLPWTAAAATVGLTVGAIVYGTSASSRYNQLHESCGQTIEGCTAAQIDNVRGRARTANVLWALAGVAAVGTGVTVYINTREAGMSALWRF